MKTRLYSEGRSAVLEASGVLGERWFTRTYAVPILSRAAVVRWVASGAQVNNYSGEEPCRLLRVKTIMQMEVLT